MHTHARTHARTHTHTHKRERERERERGMPAYMYTPTHTRACMHTNIHIYIHTCTAATGHHSATWHKQNNTLSWTSMYTHSPTQHERPATGSSSCALPGYNTTCAGLILWLRVEWKSTCSDWVCTLGFCNVYLNEAVDILNEGRV